MLVESELFEIPYQAGVCYEHNKGLILPEKVPYIGMGSSYFAALVLRYQGMKIYPEIASEYFNYLEKVRQFEKAVLISQSGESSETLWCADRFEQFVPIVNDLRSPLANHPAADVAVDLCAGRERFSSTKTYINSLTVLFLGHGIDPQPALEYNQLYFPSFKARGEEWGQLTFRLLKKRKYKGFYILGAGPNLGTAMQAAQVLTETIKLPFIGMSLAQYDHGVKEAAGRSVVFVINPVGEQGERTTKLIEKIALAGGFCIELKETGLPEKLSPFATIMPFFFMAAWLRRKLKIKEPFVVGGKVTRVTS